MRAIRNGLQGAGIPVENSKGEWGPGQEEINVRYADALEMADRHVILKNGFKEIAHGAGQGGHLHGEVALRSRGLVEPCPRLALGRWPARRRCSSIPKARARHVGADAPFSPDSSPTRARSLISWRPTSTPTSASRSARSRRPRRCGASTTAPPASGCAARTGRRSASNAASAAPISIPYLAFAALIAAGLAGDRARSWSSSAPYRGDAYQGTDAARGTEDAARGDRGAARIRRCCARRSATRSSTTMSTPRNGSSSNMTAASRIGN